MRTKLSVRLLVCAALASSASLAAVVVPGGIASAAPLTVSCTGFTGNATSQALSGCTGGGATSANAGTPPAHGTSLVSTKTITWSNGKKTHETYTYVTKTGTANTCAPKTGWTKTALIIKSGKVLAAGTTTLGMIGGAIKGDSCVYSKKVGTTTTILVVNKGPYQI